MDAYIREILSVIVFAAFVSVLAKILILAIRKKYETAPAEKVLKIEKRIWQVSLYVVVFAIGLKLLGFR